MSSKEQAVITTNLLLMCNNLMMWFLPMALNGVRRTKRQREVQKGERREGPEERRRGHKLDFITIS